MGKGITRRQLGKSAIGGLAFGATCFGEHSGVAAVANAAVVSDTKWTEILPGIWKATFGSPESITPVIARTVAPKEEALKSLPTLQSPPLAIPSAKFLARGTSLLLPLAPQEEVYGFGLQFFTVQHRSKKRCLRVNADPRIDTGDSHAPVPFYVTSHGYGILVDTARYASFYCGESRPKPDAATAEVKGGTVPLYTKNLALTDSSELLVDVPGAQGVDVYLFGGPTMLDAVRRYNLFSGGGVLPPDWGLGFWYRADSNATDRQVLALAQEFRSREIPCDVIGLEPGWHTHAYSCSFSWHPDRFPDPARFVKELGDANLHVNLWEHAFIHSSSPLFEPMRNLSGDKGVWGGLVPDFADSKARTVFSEYHGKNFVDIGISGFKLDECDNSDFTGGWSFSELSQFPSGADGEQMHSLFGLGYQRSLWQAFEKRGKQTYSLVRSSGALATPHPFVLYSDLYDHRQFVRALVNSGFSGLLWCPEVRDAKSEEDLIRRLQTAVFSPLAMVNGWYIPNPPWKQLDRKKNNANELMEHWEKLESRCKEIIGWRMQLIPYLRAAFERYTQDGTPPFRALALDWPDLPNVAKTDDAWMVGDRMLVAPLFAAEPGRKLTLPPGRWHNFWSGEAVGGNQVIDIPASTAQIPVFVKSGSIVPLAAITSSVQDPASRNLQVKIFGNGDIPFVSQNGKDESLRLSWNGEGKIEQSGAKKYTVTNWLPYR